jgi:hypothetical protein
MAKIREILRHVRVERAERKRTCHRNQAEHVIRQGDPCLAIYDGPRRARKNYCRECAQEILDLAGQDMRRILEELYGAGREAAERVPGAHGS